MEKDFGMEQLFCGCSDPQVVTMESGNHWCDSCSGLIPEDKAREKTRTAEDIISALKDKGWESKKLVGPSVLVCKHCGHHDWMKFEAVNALPEVIRVLKRSRLFECGSCGKMNNIGNAWDVMLK